MKRVRRQTAWGARLAIAAIRAYQRYLSPRKGFSCAYRHYYGDVSCSSYVLQQIRDRGLGPAIGPSRQRLAACRLAASEPRDERQRRRQPRDCQPASDPGDCTIELDNCELDWPDCDWGDCGSADCSGCDVGGCSANFWWGRLQ